MFNHGSRIRTFAIIASIMVLVAVSFGLVLTGAFNSPDKSAFFETQMTPSPTDAVLPDFVDTTEPIPDGTPEPVVVVHVTGAVASPGVYSLRSGDRVNDAIYAAGGFTEEAALDSLNLAKTIRDEQMITVLTESEWEHAINNASASAADENASIENESIENESIENGFPLRENHYTSDGLLDINKADKEDFMSLPGIGDVLSEYIIAYRDTIGAFAESEQLMNVPKIGKGTFGAIKDLVGVDAP